MKNTQIITNEAIYSKILLIRDKKVILDSELAKLYEIETGNLNKAVRRNKDRFPEDFMFRLTKEEVSSFQIGSLVNNTGPGSQIATLKKGQNIKY